MGVKEPSAGSSFLIRILEKGEFRSMRNPRSRPTGGRMMLPASVFWFSSHRKVLFLSCFTLRFSHLASIARHHLLASIARHHLLASIARRHLLASIAR